MARKPMIVVKMRVTRKIAQLRILVVVGSNVVPSVRNAAAMPSSERNSARPILVLHLRHFPLRASQEIIGILSYHFS